LWLNKINVGDKGQTIKATIQLVNTSDYSINARNLFLNYSFKNKAGVKASENIPLTETELQPGFKKNDTIDVELPTVSAKYKLVFSFDQYFLGPTFASPVYEIEVK
jgi:hypothetical protein